MKKYILIISALVFGASLVNAATPVETGLARYTSYNDLYAAGNAKISLAKVAGDKDAIRTAQAEHKTAIANWRAANAATLESLIPDVDSIADSNPGVATWIIKAVLTARNTDEAGVTAKVFAQNAADIDLARKLLTIAKGGQGYFYVQYYATAAELRALEAGNSGVYGAALRRARDLGITADFAPQWNALHLGTGLTANTYVSWFNSHVKQLARTNKDAALKVLGDEQTAVSLLPAQTTATNKRIEELRKQIALLKEVK
ncbi:hypothetical protein [Geminisphaera colitermitum]|uniref:hypothetical protein n=1 Tax=Geminisphaera colitermitum TaxID=1148786 RepID=UPI000158C81E|nr:hypothetical protein [Geminisphaera colitermitum]